MPPSHLHETVVELFRSRPGLVAELLADRLRYAVPEYAEFQVASSDLTDYQPTEYRADAVITLTDASGDPVLGVIVEAQLRPDKDKRWSWPAYLTTLRARLQCPVVLVVVSPTGALRCIAPIDSGHPGYILQPPAESVLLTPHVRADICIEHRDQQTCQYTALLAPPTPTSLTLLGARFAFRICRDEFMI